MGACTDGRIVAGVEFDGAAEIGQGIAITLHPAYQRPQGRRETTAITANSRVR